MLVDVDADNNVDTFLTHNVSGPFSFFSRRPLWRERIVWENESCESNSENSFGAAAAAEEQLLLRLQLELEFFDANDDVVDDDGDMRMFPQLFLGFCSIAVLLVVLLVNCTCDGSGHTPTV